MVIQEIVFRADASLQMGSGHVMRCLTLADAFAAQGAQCRFICRQLAGNLIATIAQRGFAVTTLPAPLPSTLAAQCNENDSCSRNAYEGWLGISYQTDALQTGTAMAGLRPDWLVVDHYAIDQQWESAMRPHTRRLMVIDDLADRPHDCDLLLDQNLGRQAQNYASLVPGQCQFLIGPHYALLRPEFATLRPYSLQRRQRPQLKRLLITMGGVDQPNATGQVLQALQACGLPPDCRITVVMGLQAQWLEQVRAQAQRMPWPTEVLVNISDMAQRMADSDLAIGAAGSTSWERCCLGLPTLMVVLADNQQPSAHALQAAQAALLLGDVGNIAVQLPLAINALLSQNRLQEMSAAAAAVNYGQGVGSVLQMMQGLNV